MFRYQLIQEFEKVATLVQKQTSIGSRHRDHANTGNTFKVIFPLMLNRRSNEIKIAAFFLCSFYRASIRH